MVFMANSVYTGNASYKEYFSNCSVLDISPGNTKIVINKIVKLDS
jgi:hypothetical protein